MDRIPFNPRYAKTIRRILGFCCVGWLLAAGAGCALLEQCGCTKPKEGPEPVERVDLFFQPYVRYVDDTQRPGVQLPGLAGRVWLYADGGKKPVAGRGTIEAEMYDMTPLASDGQAVKVAEWKFDARSLKMLKQEDKIGLGYTLFLPWETYHPEVKKVQLCLVYVDEKGAQHIASPTTLALRANEEPIQVHREERQIVPTSGPAPKK